MDTDIDIHDVDAASESSVFMYTYEATNTVHVTKQPAISVIQLAS